MSRHRLLLLLLLAVASAAIAPASALASVTISRAEVASGSLRIEGSAAPNRSITVDDVAMTTSSGSGAFKVSRSGYRPPADCTVDVNDGSAAPRGARLTGCTVTTPPPPTLPLDFVAEPDGRTVPLEVGVFANRFWIGSGGTMPYRWSIAAGTLPPGMTLIQDAPDGPGVRVGGTLTTAGPFTFTLRMTDARGVSVTHDVTLTVGDGTVIPGPVLGTGVISLTLNPSTVVGGAPTTATITLGAPAPPGGAFTSLTTADHAIVATGDSVTIPEGETTATVPIATSPVSLPRQVVIEALYTTARRATLTLNPAPVANADTVSISRAEYDRGKGTLRVEATSNRSGATLQAYATSSGAVIGTLSGGSGAFRVDNPQSVTVRSSAGGSATRTVTVK